MLISKDEFIGLDNVIHLAAGGETPMLKTHQDAVARFFADKALGVEGRERFYEVYHRCKRQVGELLGVSAETISFLSHASDGINLFANTIEWQPGDNVVVIDVEFPSDVLAWTQFGAQGVEVRIVRHNNWYVDLDAIAAQIDERTRVVAASYVSYFTGQRLPLAELSELVRASNALLLIDATHATGVVPVNAKYADVLVSSCYKWLLATHGVGILYINPERLPDLQPPFLGWHSTETSTQWMSPTSYQLKQDGGRFEPGNPTFIGLYVLDNALKRLLSIGVDNIESHVLALSELVWDGLARKECEMMTPRHSAERAGNICFMSDKLDHFAEAMAKHGILVWGSYEGVTRVRVSTHLYNSAEDVTQFLRAIQNVDLT